MKRFLLLFIISTCKMLAQDIRGAYMHTEWVPATTFTYKYKITVKLLTAHGTNVVRPTIQIHCGDNHIETFPLIGTTIGSEVDIATYEGTHLFPGPNAVFWRVYYLDSFRVTSIKNMPDSETQKIYAESKIVTNQISWMSAGIEITNFPTNLSIQGDRVFYNPAWTSTDNDSVAFSLTDCYADQYYIPGSATVDISTGVVSVSKDSIGLYAYCLSIKEYQKGTDGIYEPSHTSLFDFTVDISTTVGLLENKLINDNLEIGPNPVNDVLRIRAIKESHNITAVYIENGLGQNVFEEKAAPGDLNADLSTLLSGIYYLRVETAEGVCRRKIVKE